MFKSEKAQVVIETTVAWIVLLIFLMGATGLFLWFNATMVARQKAYERTRLAAGRLELDVDLCNECVNRECEAACQSGNQTTCDNCINRECEWPGYCHKPMVDRPEVYGVSFYNPEPLKIFKR